MLISMRKQAQAGFSGLLHAARARAACCVSCVSVCMWCVCVVCVCVCVGCVSNTAAVFSMLSSCTFGQLSSRCSGRRQELCHFAGALSPFLLTRLINGEGVQQNGSSRQRLSGVDHSAAIHLDPPSGCVHHLAVSIAVSTIWLKRNSRVDTLK